MDVNTYSEEYKYINNGSALTVYELLFIVAQAYQFLIAVDTVLNFSTIQLIALAFFNASCLIYAVVQYVQAKEITNELNKIINESQINIQTTKKYEFAVIGLMCLFVVGWCYITFRLYKIFGWNVFKQLGADIGLKQRLKLYQILLTLQKLDIFFFLAFVIQYFIFILNNKVIDINKSSKIVGILLLAITCITIVIGYIATTRCSRKLLSIFLFLLNASIGYMASILVDIHTSEKKEKYSNSKNSLTFTICGAISLGLLTFSMSLINFKNFGIGIPKAQKKNDKDISQPGTSEANEQKRWSIE